YLGFPEPRLLHRCLSVICTPCPGRISATYLHLSCLHALISQVWPISPPSQPENGQSSMILGSTTTSGQPGFILAVRGDLNEPLKYRIVLDVVVSGAIDPRTHVVQVRGN